MSNSFYINGKQLEDGLSHNRGHCREGLTALTTSPTTAGVDGQKTFIHSVFMFSCPFRGCVRLFVLACAAVQTQRNANV